MTKQRNRQAIALVETVGVVSLVGIIMSLSAVVLHHAFRAHQHSLSHLRHFESLQRLSDRVRQDVRLAVQLERVEQASQPSLVLTMPTGRQITYRATEGTLFRELMIDQQLAGHDVWPLPPATEFDCSIDAQAAKPLVAFRLTFAPSSEATTNALYPTESIEWFACAMHYQTSGTTEEKP